MTMWKDMRKIRGGGCLYPNVEHNQNISAAEVENAWKFFDDGRNLI